MYGNTRYAPRTAFKHGGAPCYAYKGQHLLRHAMRDRALLPGTVPEAPTQVAICVPDAMSENAMGCHLGPHKGLKPEPSPSLPRGKAASIETKLPFRYTYQAFTAHAGRSPPFFYIFSEKIQTPR